MEQRATKQVKCVYGDTHVVYQSDFDNPKKTLLKLVSTTASNNDPDNPMNIIHRGNIILDDTMGFQIKNEDGEYFKHQADQVIVNSEDAAQLLCEAMHKKPLNAWNSIQIAKGDIENPIFI